MKKNILKLLVFLAIFISVSFAYAKPSNAGTICCETSGGSCYDRGFECSTQSNLVDCDPTNAADVKAKCSINIAPPDQVKITDFGRLFSGAVSFLLLIAFILAFFYLILGGISWLTSGGDKANIETARNKIIAAIIGLIIVAATWALFGLIGGAIGFNILGGFELPTLY